MGRTITETKETEVAIQKEIVIVEKAKKKKIDEDGNEVDDEEAEPEVDPEADPGKFS